MTMRRMNDSGITLVEISVVLAVIGILAAVGVPSIMKIMPRVRLNNNAMILSNEIALARMRAIAKSTDFRIVFDTANGRYTTSKYLSGAWQSMGATVMTGTEIASVAGFDVADTLIARSTGQVNVPLNTQAVIELHTPEGDFQKRILVEPTGRISVQRRASSSGAWVED